MKKKFFFFFHLNVVLCVFYLQFTFFIQYYENRQCYVYSCSSFIFISLSMIVSQIMYPFYSQWLFGLFPCFCDFKQCDFEQHLCVFPSHASLLGSGSYPLAARQSQLEGLLNHRLLDSTPTVFLSVWSGALRICISNKFPKDAAAAGLRTTLGNIALSYILRSGIA